MSIEPIKAEVRGLLAQTNYDIQWSERVRARGAAGEDRVHAASQLVFLRTRKKVLERRMSELGHCRDGALSTFIQWFKEQVMVVVLSFDGWLTGR